MAGDHQVAIDADLEALHRAARSWTSLPVDRKADLLTACRSAVSRHAKRWTAAAAQAKGIAGTPLAGEEAISGPWAVLFALNRYVATLREIERFGAPRLDHRRVGVRADGRVVASVFPGGFYDRILLGGIRADVWMRPGVTPATLADTMGQWYRRSAREPRVALVLGAGNIAAIAPLDVLYKLVAGGAVCMVKMNPVNDYLGPILEDAFAPLVEGGYLRFSYGGAEVGSYLCRHPLVDEIHITGSAQTYQAILFGNDSDAAERKRRNEPLLAKPITSELGNVSPTIVVPGRWSQADLRFQAENIVTQKLHNNGFNCVAAQVLVLPAQWKQTPELIAAIEQVMRDVLDRPAYYPGAAQRDAALTAGRSGVKRFGRTGEGFLARSIVRVDAANPREALFTTEAFSSLLAIVTLSGDVDSYLRDATALANDRLMGTLGANLVIHPQSMRAHAAALDRTISDLRYGCVGVNAWTGVGFLLASAPWGAYPGHTTGDIGSGTGVVHNARLFSAPEKTVVYAPFAPFPRSLFGYGATLLPKPPWFVTNRNQARIGEALCEFEAAKTPLRLAKVAFLAMSA
jgi:aldehyde dehydrogenase (NAD(P)+)